MTEQLTTSLNQLIELNQCSLDKPACVPGLAPPPGPDHELVPRVNSTTELPCQCPNCLQKRAALEAGPPLQVPAVEQPVVEQPLAPEVPAVAPTVIPAAGRTELPVIEQTGFRKPVGSAPRRVTAPRPLGAAQ